MCRRIHSPNTVVSEWTARTNTCGQKFGTTKWNVQINPLTLSWFTLNKLAYTSSYSANLKGQEFCIVWCMIEEPEVLNTPPKPPEPDYHSCINSTPANTYLIDEKIIGRRGEDLIELHITRTNNLDRDFDVPHTAKLGCSSTLQYIYRISKAGNVLFDCNGVYDQNHYERNSSVVLLGFSLESRSMNQNHLGVLFEMAIHPHGKVVAEQTVGTNVKELIKRWITPGHHETWLRRITCGNCSPLARKIRD
ncbi:hypothetical protein B0H13DRAFT_1888356 [Mycena leptocephala]|nr:hypothetical protein B0H13DRAFT_1888356 [Mycena leptocephala]